MQRLPEPELMDDAEEALAYEQADFSASNQRFVTALLERTALPPFARVVDLGCGPADIPIRLARAVPGCTIIAVDGAQEMLVRARAAVARADLGHRVSVVKGRLPGLPLPACDVVMSNSVVHHMPDPVLFWREARRLSAPRGWIHVMDLARPDSAEAARAIVDAAAADAPPILRRDFYFSLLAAFTPDEVAAQLAAAGLGHLGCVMLTDRHWLVSGPAAAPAG